MNVQNKKLFEAAGFKMFDDKVAAGGFTTSEKMTENCEKLIKLVAEQCANLAANQIKEHFGVEE